MNTKMFRKYSTIMTDNLQRDAAPQPAWLAMAAGLEQIAIQDDTLFPKGVSFYSPQKNSLLSEPVSRHTDLQYHYIPETKTLFHVKGSPVPAILDSQIRIVEGLQGLSPVYPGDVLCNAARCGPCAFARIESLDPVLIRLFNEADLELVPVNQGYAGCSCLCIHDGEQYGLITADLGIYEASCRKKIKALFIPPQKNILLPGYPYGFIGGTAGMMGNTLYITGKIKWLDSYAEIREFLSGFSIDVVELTQQAPIDVGGLLFIPLFYENQTKTCSTLSSGG